MTISSVGIIGYGNYGKLLLELIRRFCVEVEVVVYDKDREPDGRTFTTLSEIVWSDMIILAVPIHALESVLKEIMDHKPRKEVIFVEMCTSKTKPGELLERYCAEHPWISLHTPWGPEGYNNVGGDVRKLPPVIVTNHTLEPDLYEELKAFAQTRHIGVVDLPAKEHDRLIVGKKMFITHLISQTMSGMGLLDNDPTDLMAPLSYQDLKRGALAVRGDVGIFLDVWLDEAECQRTFEAFLKQVRRLEHMKDVRMEGK